MEIYKLKFTQLQMEMFRLLCIKAGDKLSQNKIAKLLKVSPTAVAKSLPKLNDLIKINKSKEMNLNLIQLNRESNKVIQLKRAENIKLLYESNLADFLIDNHPGCTIILFGSYSKGEDTISSDLDLAIIGSKKKQLDLNKYQNVLERDIRINYFKAFKEVDKHFKESLYNGIIISGGIEL